MATDNLEAINSLASKLESEDGITRVKARKALVTYGKMAVPSLIEIMKDKNDWTRWEAAKALAEIGDSASTNALIDALEDHEFEVRWLAAEGLIHIGASSLEPLLDALIHRPDSAWLLEGAHHVLHDLREPKFGQHIRPVIAALEDMEPSLKVGIAARAALEAIK